MWVRRYLLLTTVGLSLAGCPQQNLGPTNTPQCLALGAACGEQDTCCGGPTVQCSPDSLGGPDCCVPANQIPQSQNGADCCSHSANDAHECLPIPSQVQGTPGTSGGIVHAGTTTTGGSTTGFGGVSGGTTGNPRAITGASSSTAYGGATGGTTSGGRINGGSTTAYGGATGGGTNGARVNGGSTAAFGGANGVTGNGGGRAPACTQNESSACTPGYNWCCDPQAGGGCRQDANGYSVCCVPDGIQPSIGGARACCSQNGVDGFGNCIPLGGYSGPNPLGCGAAIASCLLSTQCCGFPFVSCQPTPFGNSSCCTANGQAPPAGSAADCCSRSGLDFTGAITGTIGACVPYGTGVSGGQSTGGTTVNCLNPQVTCPTQASCCNSPGAGCHPNSQGQGSVCCIPDGVPSYALNGSDCCSVGQMDPVSHNCGVTATPPGGNNGGNNGGTSPGCTADQNTCVGAKCCDTNASCAAPASGGSQVCCVGTGKIPQVPNQSACCSGQAQQNGTCCTASAQTCASGDTCCATGAVCQPDVNGANKCCVAAPGKSTQNGADCCSYQADSSGNCTTASSTCGQNGLDCTSCNSCQSSTESCTAQGSGSSRCCVANGGYADPPAGQVSGNDPSTCCSKSAPQGYCCIPNNGQDPDDPMGANCCSGTASNGSCTPAQTDCVQGEGPASQCGSNPNCCDSTEEPGLMVTCQALPGQSEPTCCVQNCASSTGEGTNCNADGVCTNTSCCSGQSQNNVCGTSWKKTGESCASTDCCQTQYGCQSNSTCCVPDGNPPVGAGSSCCSGNPGTGLWCGGASQTPCGGACAAPLICAEGASPQTPCTCGSGGNIVPNGQSCMPGQDCCQSGSKCNLISEGPGLLGGNAPYWFGCVNPSQGPGNATPPTNCTLLQASCLGETCCYAPTAGCTNGTCCVPSGTPALNGQAITCCSGTTDASGACQGASSTCPAGTSGSIVSGQQCRPLLDCCANGQTCSDTTIQDPNTGLGNQIGQAYFCGTSGAVVACVPFLNTCGFNGSKACCDSVPCTGGLCCIPAGSPSIDSGGVACCNQRGVANGNCN